MKKMFICLLSVVLILTPFLVYANNVVAPTGMFTTVGDDFRTLAGNDVSSLIPLMDQFFENTAHAIDIDDGMISFWASGAFPLFYNYLGGTEEEWLAKTLYERVNYNSFVRMPESIIFRWVRGVDTNDRTSFTDQYDRALQIIANYDEDYFNELLVIGYWVWDFYVENFELVNVIDVYNIHLAGLGTAQAAIDDTDTDYTAETPETVNQREQNTRPNQILESESEYVEIDESANSELSPIGRVMEAIRGYWVPTAILAIAGPAYFITRHRNKKTELQSAAKEPSKKRQFVSNE